MVPDPSGKVSIISIQRKKIKFYGILFRGLEPGMDSPEKLGRPASTDLNPSDFIEESPFLPMFVLIFRIIVDCSCSLEEFSFWKEALQIGGNLC